MSDKKALSSGSTPVTKSIKLSLTKKKIESPLAKYNNAGQLLCIVCNTVVKSDLVWTAHINGRQHRENVSALKERKEKPNQPETAVPAPIKRKHEQDNPTPTFKVPAASPNPNTKSALPSDFFESSNAKPSKPIKSILKNSSSDTPPVVTKNQALPTPRTVQPSPSVEKGPIPAGFFDDPMADAKARQIEYKDPSQEEWDKFTKEIAEAELEARTLVEEDVEEAGKERTLEEIDDQLDNWSRVVNLVKKKEALLTKRTAPTSHEDSSSSADEEECSEFLDWRSKKTFR